ncbi:DMT family transporter [Azotosporobacter soli]|uniref:DMT family transporter n=1 Tax=Azotosporobacter soli TaxID=3055040 RepID=UPI0031FF3A1D
MRWTGVLAVLASAAGFATVAIFIKYAYEAGASTFTILTVRFSLAALLLAAAAAWRKMTLRLPGKRLRHLLVLGAFGYGLMAILFAASLRHVSASIGALLLYAYPALVTLIAAALGDEKMQRQKALSLLICFIGLGFVLGISFQQLSGLGIALGLASALVYAAYIVFSNRLLKEIPALVAATYVCGAAALLCALGGLLSDSLAFELPLSGWLALAGIAFFGTVVGVLGFLLGMNRVGPANASIISMIEPVITVLLSALLLGDRLSLPQLSGGSLILLGIVLLQLGTARAKKAA